MIIFHVLNGIKYLVNVKSVLYQNIHFISRKGLVYGKEATGGERERETELARAIVLFQQLSDTSWVSSHLIRFCHYLPGVNVRFHRFKGSVPKDCLLFRCQLQVLAIPEHFFPTVYKYRVSMVPLQDLIIC